MTLDTLTLERERACPSLTSGPALACPVLTHVGGASLPRVLPTIAHQTPDTLTPGHELASPLLTNVGGASLPRVLPRNGHESLDTLTPDPERVPIVT